MKILVAGGSGFIGRRLIQKLTESRSHVHPPTSSSTPNQIFCITRNPKSVEGFFAEGVRVLKGDASNYGDLKRIMTPEDGGGAIDVAYYLIHSMEGNSKEWKKFAERDRKAALNFAKAATDCGVKRIIYLGGLSHGKDHEQSEHMKSRNEVGDILRTSSAKTTIFKAAVILGSGGGSFQMLQYLVERLPVMVCPRWVLTRSQPIAVDDVATYLVRAAEIADTEGKTFEIGGPDVLTYIDMMKRYSLMIHKRVRILILPFLTPRLSSYWIDLVTPVRASLARPLIDSLKHEAIVHDDSIGRAIPIPLKSFEQSISAAMKERDAHSTTTIPAKTKQTTPSLNPKLLAISLLSLATAGFLNYVVQQWQDPLQFGNLAMIVIWYTGIAFAMYFVKQGARLGAFVAGIVGWITLAFWLFEAQSLVSSTFRPAATVLPFPFWLYVAGLVTVCAVIALSHDVFHKLGMAATK
jgi:uncharacterized protein YbjT (DUF2867 family)